MDTTNIPLTGPAAITHALSRIDIGTAEEEHRNMVKNGPKSKRSKAVQALNALEGLKRNSLRPDQLMIKSVPVIPPVFRPFSVVGDSFVPGDANELYRDLFHYRDIYKQTNDMFGAAGNSEATLDLYDTAKALYGHGEPIAPKTKQRGVSGFLQQVTGVSPKYCYDDETDILTRDGWVKFAALREDVDVATINPETLAFEWQRPTAYIHDRYIGEMFHWKSARFDMLVTPNHRMWFRSRKAKETLTEPNMQEGWVVAPAYKVANSGTRRWYQTAAVDWVGQTTELPEIFRAWGPELFAQWLGWWLAEGDIHTDGAIVTIWQSLKDDADCQELDNILNKLQALGVDAGKIPHNKNGELYGYGWRIKGARAIAEWLEQNCGRGCANKKVPEFIRNWPEDLLRVLTTSYLKGDGAKRKQWDAKVENCPTHKFRSELTDTHGSFITTSRRLFDDLSEVFCKLGVTVVRRKDYPHIREKREIAEGKEPGSYAETFVGGLIGRWNCVAETKAKVVHYDGYVHCCSVPNGLLVVRRNDKPVVSGNSFFQRKLISKPQDNVARGTIAIDPDLSMDSIAIPREMAWKMYSPYIQRRLVRSGLKPGDALMNLKDRTPLAQQAMERETEVRPVIYSRSPSWHKFNVIAGKPKLIDGDTIMVNPLITAGMTADFDGDAINLHVPAMDDSVTEAMEKLLPSKMLWSIKNQDAVVPLPAQEMILGLYTANKRPAKNKHKFASEAEAIAAIRRGDVELSDDIEIIK